jgi:hypothetical protein
MPRFAAIRGGQQGTVAPYPTCLPIGKLNAMEIRGMMINGNPPMTAIIRFPNPSVSGQESFVRVEKINGLHTRLIGCLDRNFWRCS